MSGSKTFIELCYEHPKYAEAFIDLTGDRINYELVDNKCIICLESYSTYMFTQ